MLLQQEVQEVQVAAVVQGMQELPEVQLVQEVPEVQECAPHVVLHMQGEVEHQFGRSRA